jgi:hypothetical protein
LPNLTVDHSNVSLMMINDPRACCGLLVHKAECRALGERKTAGNASTTIIPMTVGNVVIDQ